MCKTLENDEWGKRLEQMSEQEQRQESPENNDDEGFDFTHVNSVARIALYELAERAACH